MKPAIALFARAPVPGLVKTRLIGRFSAEEACGLYQAFVRDAWEMLQSLPGNAELFLYADQPHLNWTDLAGGRLRLQHGADLGERMLRCFEELHAEDFGPLLIVGSDSPALPASHLASWQETAAAGSVLGPCDDGGYYAIGCREPHPRMFDGVEWSSPRTQAQTADSLSSCGMPPAYLPGHYDVDTPDDVDRLAAERVLPPYTREWLRRHAIISM